MAEETVLQVKMDADLKRQAEELYRDMGTTFEDAVRMFARQSVQERALPFTLHVPFKGGKRPLGIADGKFTIPDDLDFCNHEIREMFTRP